MAVDSRAVFSLRLAELGLGELQEKFDGAGWNTHGAFAFSVPQVPGGLVDDEVFKTRVVSRLFEVAEGDESPLTPQVRRLYFESHSLVLGEMRQRLERTDHDLPRKVPTAEREARKEAIRRKLAPGLVIEGELDPANCVIDRYVQQVEDNTVEWIPWEEVPKRDQELAGAPGRRKWIADHMGVVREKSVKPEVMADVGSALRISNALLRRGVALEVAGLMSFTAHERLRARLIRAFTDAPSDPRFGAPSVEQVRRADKEAWRMLSKACRAGVRARSAADPLPADAAIDGVLSSVDFALVLLPMPTSGRGKRRAAASSSSTEGNATKKRKQRRKTKQANTQPVPKQEPSSSSQPPSKGKGKGKQRPHGDTMPKALTGGVSRTADGQPICFAFNLGGCSAARPGERCPRGVHICTRKGCGGKHPQSECCM